MESEPKTKHNRSKSPQNDSITRVLKYESDLDLSSFPSKSQDSLSQQDKALKGSKTRENPSFKEEEHENSTSKNKGNAPVASGSQLAGAAIKIKQEENIFSKEKKDTGPSDTTFNEFCKGLQLSPLTGKTKAPLDFTKSHSCDHSKQKTISAPSHKTLFKQKATNNTGSTSAKKNIERLDLNNRLVFIRSIRTEINIQVEDSNRQEEDNKSDGNQDLDLSMHCSEDNIETEEKKMNTEYDTNNMRPESPHSERPGKNEFFQQWDLLESTRTGFDSNPQPEEFGTFQMEGMDTDGMAKFGAENSQSFTLASLNSFAGQKSHLERAPIMKISAFDMNMNDMNQDSHSHKHANNPFALGSEQKDGKKKIICNCKKSKCLKLYCDCFAAGEECGPECNCNDCCNHENHPERIAAVGSTLERNPNAFKPKVDKIEVQSPTAQKVVGDAANARHSKGCNCKKSGCLKKYCECYQAGIKCTEICKCEGCKNIDPATAMKKSRSMIMSGFGSQEMFMGFENSQSSFLGSHGHCHSRHAYFGRKGLDENIFEEEKEEEEEDEEEMDKLQKKRSIGNFNSYQTSTLLDELISPLKSVTKLDEIIGIKVKNEETSSKKEEASASAKPERKRKKAQNEKKVKI